MWFTVHSWQWKKIKRQLILSPGHLHNLDAISSLFKQELHCNCFCYYISHGSYRNSTTATTSCTRLIYLNPRCWQMGQLYFFTLQFDYNNVIPLYILLGTTLTNNTQLLKVRASWPDNENTGNISMDLSNMFFITESTIWSLEVEQSTGKYYF